MNRFRRTVFAALLAALPAQAFAAPTTYTLDAARSWLYVVVKYDRNAAMAGHDHVLRASSFRGTVTWDPDDVSACKVEIRFPVTALTVDPPGARAREGFEGETSDGDKPKILSNALGRHQLESDRFSDISFQSTRCAASGDTVQVTGNMTIHGVTASVTAPMRITADGASFTAKGSFMSNHATWGLDPFTALLGALRNAPELKFVGDLTGSAS